MPIRMILLAFACLIACLRVGFNHVWAVYINWARALARQFLKGSLQSNLFNFHARIQEFSRQEGSRSI